MFDGIMPADVLKSGRGPRMSDDDELFETESELGWFARSGRLIFDWGIAAVLALRDFGPSGFGVLLSCQKMRQAGS